MILKLVMRCLALALVAAIPVAINVWIDPARLRPWPADERAIADALLAGHDVTDVVNFSERAIERLLAHSRAHAADVLALGSSRIQPLPASAFPGRTFVNAGVPGAGLDDILAVYALYDTDARRPRHVVLNVDPWSLEDNAIAPVRLLTEHAATMRRLGDYTSPVATEVRAYVDAMKRLAAPEYFRLAMFSLRRRGPAGIRFVVTDRAQNEEKTMTPEGTIVWSRNPPEKTELLTRDYIDQMRRNTAPYNGRDSELVPARLDLLERFVRLLRRDGVEVTLLLVPFHPLVWAEFAGRPRNAPADAEARFRSLASRTGAQVAGSFDPSREHAAAADFFDHSHMRPEALVRLITAR